MDIAIGGKGYNVEGIVKHSKANFVQMNAGRMGTEEEVSHIYDECQKAMAKASVKQAGETTPATEAKEQPSIPAKRTPTKQKKQPKGDNEEDANSSEN